MDRRERHVCLFCIVLVCLILVGCGGGTSTPTLAPPSPGFTISLSPASVTLAQGAASQPVQVSATLNGGFTGSVSVTVASLPAGVTVSPTSLSITSGSPATFNFSASRVAGNLQQSISINAVSGTLTANTSLQLTVTGTVVSDPYHPIGGSMVHGFYDESRQLLFATNLGLNELDVISGHDFSIKARVPVSQPLGIDQMADGKTLVIGTEAQEIVTVNEDSYSVAQYPYSGKGNYSFSLFFPTVVAMANGKVIIIGQEQGIDSSNIVDGGQYLLEWDSNVNTFSQIEPTGNNPWETDSLARSADHKWAVFAGDQFYLYSSDSDSLTSVSFNTANPPQNLYGVRGYAVNADGSKIAVVSATQITFLNNSLNVLASTPIPGGFQTARTAVQFSHDGSRLYLQYDLPITIEEIDTTSYNALGYLSGTVIPDADNLERMLATDSQGRAYIGIDEGLRIVDLTQPPVPNSTASPNPYPCPISSVVMQLNTPMQMQLVNMYTSLSVYVGGQPAPLLDGGRAISIPASSNAGSTDVVCTDGNGNTAVVPNGVSYGVEPVGFSANLLPPFGNPNAYLFGFGLFPPPFGPASSVSLGGQSALNVNMLNNVGLGALEGESMRVPNGTPSEFVNIGVTDSLGAGTLLSGTSYYKSPTIIPASGILQLTFDGHRNRLYALKATEIDVLNAATMLWQSPLVFPAAGTGVYSAMALTPDGSKLVVAGSAGTTPQVIVLDPDNVSPPSVLTYTGSITATPYGSIAITKFNTVILPGARGLALDLSSSTFSLLPLNAGGQFNFGQIVKASADGSHLYSVQLNSSAGTVYSLDPSTYAIQSESFGLAFWTDLAASPDGSQFAAVDAPIGSAGDIVGFFNSSLQYVNANVYPDFSPPDDTGVLGASFSPAGKVLLVPLGDSLEFWDAIQGTLRSRLMTPEELHTTVGGALAPMIALDSTGQTIYAVSASGLTVLTLPEPLDQMTPVQWAHSRPSVNVRPELHGSLASRMAALRNVNSAHLP
jgi:hypothetical protein